MENNPPESKRECKGKGAARALAAMVLDRRISAYLALHDPQALKQARLALIPFGYPGPMPSLEAPTGPRTPQEDPGPPEAWKDSDEAFHRIVGDLAQYPED